MMDELPVPASATVQPAAPVAANTCKPIAVAKPILRTTQSIDPPATLRIKDDRAASSHQHQMSCPSSDGSDCQHNNVAAGRHNHYAAHSSEAEHFTKSRDADHACAAANATTCSHVSSSVLSTGDVFRQLTGCSFYFGRLSVSEANKKLSRCSVGTFLLRDSSDHRFLFALSVQTHRGPTSIRLSRDESGRFRLYCDPSQRSVMPTFASVIDLIRFYFRPVTDRRCVLVSSDSSEHNIPVRLTAYLTATGNPMTLADLARLSVHQARLRNLERSSTLRIKDSRECVECFVDSLPPDVDERAKNFLRHYPFDI